MLSDHPVVLGASRKSTHKSNLSASGISILNPLERVKIITLLLCKTQDTQGPQRSSCAFVKSLPNLHQLSDQKDYCYRCPLLARLDSYVEVASSGSGVSPSEA